MAAGVGRVVALVGVGGPKGRDGVKLGDQADVWARLSRIQAGRKPGVGRVLIGEPCLF